MATKKSASKKIAGSEATTEKPAAKKSAAKKTVAKKTVNVQASAGTEPGSKAAAETIAEAKASGLTAGNAGKTAKPKASHGEIAARAHEKWEHSGRRHGQHDQHWHEAERELNS